MSFPQLSIFDLDKTLILVNGSFAFGKWLYSRGDLSLVDMAANVQDYLLHRLNLLSLKKLHEKSRHRFLKRRTLASLTLLAERFVDEKLPYLLNMTVVERLNSAKHRLLLSSSPSFLVEPIARALNIQDFGATSWDPLQVIDGQAKLQLSKKFADHLGIPLNECIAYSDSHLDIPLMEAVGKPILVNPDKTLRIFGLKNNWEFL